ncbi:vWA domain-containing protein [Kutzneria sp. CA-103260]|uniref:vWA domain-containing protein n=1 Tax=Kutzneria sp. CA-103260 TaxID=2802641 RepID=UPI001BA9452A|nr:hypothetical protein [Kutzneria sp. CA-103260]
MEPVLPCYVVCDFSPSMTDYIGDLRAGLREFRGALHADPVAAARIRVCVIVVGPTPRVQQPLRPAAELVDLAERIPCAGTNFGPVFELLRVTIERDVNVLNGHRRPIVFFASDGRPTDPLAWPAALAALTDPAWPGNPEMIAFGVGAADRDTLTRIGTGRVFLGGVRMGAALSASVLIHAVSTSGPLARPTLSGNGDVLGEADR